MMGNPTITNLATLTGAWILDPNGTVIRFQTSIMRLIKVNGTFAALEGHAILAANGVLTGGVVIDVASIDTKIAKRDNHLRGSDFFDVESYPWMTFRAIDGHLTGAGQVELLGDLEIHGNTRPLTLRADVSNIGTSLRFCSEIDIDRTDWGVSYAAQVRSSRRIHVDISAYFNRT
jgi:polyisoprenoid-binding protein YceI